MDAKPVGTYRNIGHHSETIQTETRLHFAPTAQEARGVWVDRPCPKVVTFSVAEEPLSYPYSAARVS